MYEIKDISQLESIHGGDKCDFATANDCLLLYSGFLIIFGGPVVAWIGTATWSHILGGVTLGGGLAHWLYKSFGGAIIPKCAVPADYVNFQVSCNLP